MAKKSALEWVVLVLLIVGGLNWGLVGLWNYDLVVALLGAWPMLIKTVYVLVGLAALYDLWWVVKK